MNINFLIQSMLILSQDIYNGDELRMIYDYLLYLDNEILFSYYMNNTVPGYESDLHLYIDVVNETIKKLELCEEYEKCNQLKIRRNNSLKLINDYKIM